MNEKEKSGEKSRNIKNKPDKTKVKSRTIKDKTGGKFQSERIRG